MLLAGVTAELPGGRDRPGGVRGRVEPGEEGYQRGEPGPGDRSEDRSPGGGYGSGSGSGLGSTLHM